MTTKSELESTVVELESVLSDVAGLVGTGDQMFTPTEEGEWAGIVDVVKAKISALQDEATAARAAKTTQDDDLRRAREAVARLEAEVVKKAPAPVAPVAPPQPSLSQMAPEALVQEVVRLRGDLKTTRTERDSFCRQVNEQKS